jgi:hypothetical protein
MLLKLATSWEKLSSRPPCFPFAVIPDMDPVLSK